jgi:hypothetical protein
MQIFHLENSLMFLKIKNSLQEKSRFFHSRPSYYDNISADQRLYYRRLSHSPDYLFGRFIARIIDLALPFLGI